MSGVTIFPDCADERDGKYYTSVSVLDRSLFNAPSSPSRARSDVRRRSSRDPNPSTSLSLELADGVARAGAPSTPSTPPRRDRYRSSRDRSREISRASSRTHRRALVKDGADAREHSLRSKIEVDRGLSRSRSFPSRSTCVAHHVLKTHARERSRRWTRGPRRGRSNSSSARREDARARPRSSANGRPRGTEGRRDRYLP